jgi:AraC-like DNA-binding protein
MNFLPSGRYFGQINRTIHLSGIILTDTDTELVLEQTGWHYHENAYFTLILRGEIIEGNKRESHHCSAGSLLFHYRQEPHYNIKPAGSTRCFHVEFDKKCLDNFSFDISALQGSIGIENPDIKFLIYKIFRETKIYDDLTPVSIQMLLFDILGQTLRLEQTEKKAKPFWAKKLKEILRDGYAEKLSLEMLSRELKIHPVHLSRDFSKYFNCTFGEYVRKTRIEKSLALLPDKNLSLTEIAFDCGFADQSHFLRCFKQITGTAPSAYRKLLES